MINKEEVMKANESAVGQRIFVLSLGGYYADVRSVIDENTFEVVSVASGKIYRVDLYDIRSLDSKVAPILPFIQNPK